jgi:hypothetical protein
MPLEGDWQALYLEGFQHRFDDGLPMVLVRAGSFTIGANPAGSEGEWSLSAWSWGLIDLAANPHRH